MHAATKYQGRQWYIRPTTVRSVIESSLSESHAASRVSNAEIDHGTRVPVAGSLCVVNVARGGDDFLT